MYRDPNQSRRSYRLLLAGVVLGAGLFSAQAGFDVRFYGGSFGFGVETPIEGTAVEDLLNDAQYPDDPVFTDYYTAKPGETGPSFILTQTSGMVEYPQEFDEGDNGDNYGGAVSGVFYAPRDGTYQFFIRSDDASALYISSDATRSGLPATPDAEEPACCNAFLEDGVRNTEPIEMTAGEARLMEFLWKEAGGGDWFQIGFSIDGSAPQVMPAAYFQRDVNAPGLISLSGINGGPNADGVNQNGIVRPPEDTTVLEQNDVHFFVEFDKSGAATLQWQTMDGGDWVDIEGEVSPRLTVYAEIPDDGTQYRVVVDETPSAAATLLVDPDVVPPEVQFADHRGNPNGVRVFFTELVSQASAENTSNYTLTGPSGNLPIDSAELLEDGMTVQLLGSFDFQLEQTYDLTIRNIQDRAFAPNTLSPNPTTQSIVFAGGEPIVFDFNSDPVDGLELYGNATVVPSGSFDDSGYLSVTDALDSQLGAAKLTQRFSVQQVMFEIMMRITAEGGDSTNPADGFSFNVAEDLPDGTYGQSEEGYSGGEDPSTFPQGLIVAFDNWESGGSDNGVGIDIKYQGELKHFVALPKTGADPSEDPDTGFPTLVRDGWFPVVIDLKADGTLTVDYDGIRVIDRVDIGWEGINNAQLGFGARTGGENETHHFDNVSVNLQGGEVGPITIKEQPQGQEDVPEHQEVLLAVEIGGSEAGLTAQWYLDDNPIDGATTLSHRFIATPSTAGAYTVTVANDFSEATSEPAVVTVVPDTTAPTLTNIEGSAGFNQVTLDFSEPLAAEPAENIDSYGIDGGLSIDDATLSGDGTRVTLTTSTQAQATQYTVTINGLEDLAETPNTITADTTASFFSYGVGRGNVLWEYWGGITGTAVNLLTDDARYPDNPDEVRSGSAFHSRTVPTFDTDSHENYGARMSAVLIPPETGQYRFFLRSDDASEFWINPNGESFEPDQMTLIMQQTGCCNAMTVADGTLSALVDLEAGQRYAVVGLLKEGGGGDYLTVGWRRPSEDLEVPVADDAGIPGEFLEAIGPAQGEENLFTASPAPGGLANQYSPIQIDATLQDGAGNTVDESTVVVTVNGEEVDAQVARNRDLVTVDYTIDPMTLPPSSAVEILLNYNLSDGTAASQSWSFNTLADYSSMFPEGTRYIEANDYNYEGGNWIENGNGGPTGQPYSGGAYADLVAIEGIDIHETGDDTSDGGANYRTTDTAPDQVIGDDLYNNGNNPVRGGFVLDSNWKIGWTAPGEWWNYTRDFPETDTEYAVYASLASGGTDPDPTLALVTSDPTQPDQTTQDVGQFSGAASGDWGTAVFYKMHEVGNPDTDATVTLSGVNTLRLTVGPGNMDFNYLAFVPADLIPGEASIDGISIAADTVTINYTGQLQEADSVDGPYADVAGETDGSYSVSVTGQTEKYYRARAQ